MPSMIRGGERLGNEGTQPYVVWVVQVEHVAFERLEESRTHGDFARCSGSMAFSLSLANVLSFNTLATSS